MSNLKKNYFTLENNCKYCDGRTWKLSTYVPLGSGATQFCFDCGKVSNKMSIIWVFLYATIIFSVSAYAFYYFNMRDMATLGQIPGQAMFFWEVVGILGKVSIITVYFIKFFWVTSTLSIPLWAFGFCIYIVSVKINHIIFMISSSDYKQYPEPNRLWVLSLVLIVFALAILSLISFFIVFAWIVGG